MGPFNSSGKSLQVLKVITSAKMGRWTNPSHTALKGMKAMYRVRVRWHCQRAAGLSVRRGPAGAWLGPTDKMGAPLWWHTQERTKTGKEKQGEHQGQ